MSTTVMVRGRGGGKTYAVAEWILEQVLDNPDARIFIGVVNSDDGKYIMDQINDLLGEYGPVTYLPALREIRFFNGAWARFYMDTPAEIFRIRGVKFTGATGEQLEFWSDDLFRVCQELNYGPAFFTSLSAGPMIDLALGGSFIATGGHTRVSPEYEQRVRDTYE